MKGMILAAGVGSRLGELTRNTPKCLVTVGGVTMLERVALRMKAAGVTELMINVHHLAERVVEFVRERVGFGMRVDF